ncbi:MAG: MlaD family protein [Steroidobacteraceae bacterium]
MEREANYAAVGAFVLLVIVMGGLFVYWYSDASDKREFTRYEIYFDSSVSGLTKGSTVRYLGVDVGRVVDIRIDKRSATRVQIVADVDSTAPVSDQTVAELSLQGVTGLLYIDLVRSRDSSTLTAAVPSERYPVIPSVRSNFDEFVRSLPDVMARAGDVASRLNAVLSDANIAAITRTVNSIETAATGLPEVVRESRALLGELRQTAREVGAVASQARAVTDTAGPDFKRTIARVREVADNLANTTARLDAVLAANQDDLQAFSARTLPEFERLLRDSRLAMQEFDRLSRSLKDNPSQIIYQPQPKGMEIAR